MTISIGLGITNTAVRRLELPRSAAALARALHEAGTPTMWQPWWSPCVWSGDVRGGAHWIRADCVALDVDHQEERALTVDERQTLHALVQRVACNVYHDSPKGCRLIIILKETCADSDRVARALLGFAKHAADALSDAPWLQPDRRVTSDARARALYTPRGRAKPDKEQHPRDAHTVVMRDELFEIEQLESWAPAAAPTPKLRAQVTSSGSTARTARASSTVDEAVQRWNRDHARSFEDPDRECPACGHRGCFGPLPGNPDRWFCFSANHEADSGQCGLPAPSLMGWSGDALDLDARERGLSRIELLRADGYLDRLRHEPLRFEEESDLQLAGPAPGTVVVTNFADAHAHVTQALRCWRIGDGSLQIVGAAGSGKTTAARVELVQRLSSGAIRIAILAEHSAELVMEKAKAARADLADDAQIDVVELLGARAQPVHGFLCVHPEHRAEFAELGVSACEGCPLMRNKLCESQPGSYRYDSAAAMGRIRGSSRVLVVTTHARLPMLLRDLSRPSETAAGSTSETPLDDVAVVIDDDGRTAGGLLLDQPLQADIAESALDHVGQLLLRADLDAAWTALKRGTLLAPDAVLADIVRRVLGVIADSAVGDEQPIRAVLDELHKAHPEFIEALKHGTFDRPWISFESTSSGDGEDRRPALSDLCLRLLSLEQQLHGVTVKALKHKKRTLRWTLRIANVDLAKLARAGRVCWLSIGALPAHVAELFKVKSIRLESRPASLTTIAVSDYSFGRMQGAIVTAAYVAVHDRAITGPIDLDGASYRKPGGVLRKTDRESFAKTAPKAYDACGHYGAAHSATDRFADRDVFVIGRHYLPPGTVASHARALRRAFPDLPARALGEDEPATVEAQVGWWGQPKHWLGRVFVDPLEADIDEAWRRQHLVNAAGRIRALSSDERKLLVILDGDPCPGLFVDRAVELQGLVDLLALEGEDIARAVQACADEAERRARAESREAEEPEHPLVPLAEEAITRWIATFGVAPTLKELRVALRALEIDLSRDDVRALRAEVEARKSRRPHSEVAVSTHCKVSIAALHADTIALLPSASAIAATTGASERTVERHLAGLRAWLLGGPPPVISRSHARRNWIGTAQAIRASMSEAGTWYALSSHPFADAACFDFGGADCRLNTTRVTAQQLLRGKEGGAQ